ncbi:MAG: archaetidylserine decarboxylase [Chromatocurvus sp.]
MTTLFIWLQHCLPQHLLSRIVGSLARARQPRWLVSWVIRRFVAHYNVNLAEAQAADVSAYRSFNAFFTRSLKPDARPLADADLVCPADGVLSQFGAIYGGRLLQAKGRHFALDELLGGDTARASIFNDGAFATIYLSPRDYHRVHMPMAGRLTATCYIPGRLFSVNAVTAEGVDRLFARNERLVCYFDGPRGPFAMVLVGAMIVAGIETVWSGQVAPPPRRPVSKDYSVLPTPVSLERGDEMGRFLLGSTVILLFPPGAPVFNRALAPGAQTRIGEAMGAYDEAPKGT